MMMLMQVNPKFLGCGHLSAMSAEQTNKLTKAKQLENKRHKAIHPKAISRPAGRVVVTAAALMACQLTI